jgi:hypothetical protein
METSVIVNCILLASAINLFAVWWFFKNRRLWLINGKIEFIFNLVLANVINPSEIVDGFIGSCLMSVFGDPYFRGSELNGAEYLNYRLGSFNDKDKNRIVEAELNRLLLKYSLRFKEEIECGGKSGASKKGIDQP